MKELAANNLSSVLPVILEMAVLTFAALIDPYIQKRPRKTLLIIVALIATLLAQSWLDFDLGFRSDVILLRKIVAVWGYSVRPIVILLFCAIVDEKKDRRLLWLLVAVNALIHLMTFFSDICFTFNENNLFRRGPLGYACHITSGICLMYLFFLTLASHKEIPNKERAVLLGNVMLIVLSVVWDVLQIKSDTPPTMMTAVISASLFFYIWLHIQFVRDHERALMAEQRIQIMMSQIQPHFLYNTLSTIQALCLKDPKKAFDVTERFGTYLRQNLESLNQSGLIPFSKELEHTSVYVEIESVRFPNISVEYDIQDDDFALPPLTVQPLVENAIRHGVRVRKNGVVRVSTVRREDWHEITISDNGKGFDTKKLNALEAKTASWEGGSHIGLNNVRERIEKKCRGSLEVKSVVGEGTEVTIRIPQDGTRWTKPAENRIRREENTR